MTAHRDPDRLVAAFMREGQTELADQVYDHVRATIEHRRQRTALGPSWLPGRASRPHTLGAAAVVAAVLIGAQLFGPAAPGIGTAPSPSPSATPSPSPSATAEPSAATTSDAADALLTGFLEARIAGAGAQPYLSDPEGGFPLLYTTSTGAGYERAEFEPVLGPEWPYGFSAFKVRLFAGDTVVEQLVFMPPDGPTLEYHPDGFATDIPPTSEDGQSTTSPHDYFDGAVTLQGGHPWVFHEIWPGARLIPEGPGVPPTTDGGQRYEWDHIVLTADPVGVDCPPSPGVIDPPALAEDIRSDPDLQATDPVGLRISGADAVMLDVEVPAGTTICDPADEIGNPLRLGVLTPVFDDFGSMRFVDGLIHGSANGELMRLYLIDAPVGSSMRVLSVAIVAPEARFQRAVEAAAPVIESVEFHVP